MNYAAFYFLNVLFYLQVVRSMNYWRDDRRGRYYYYMPLSISNSLKFRRGEPKSLPPCNEDQLMMYLAEIQAINPESIINLAAYDDLNTLCSLVTDLQTALCITIYQLIFSKVSDDLNKMNDYLATCDPPQQKDLYIQLIKGVDSLHDKVCAEGAFKKQFKQHYQCFHDLRDDFQDCMGPADWTEDSNDFKVCKAYRDVADCYYVKTAKLCGKEAAGVIKELLMAIINSVLVINCDNVKENPIVSDAMPDLHATTITKSNADSANINYILFFVSMIILFCNGYINCIKP